MEALTRFARQTRFLTGNHRFAAHILGQHVGSPRLRKLVLDLGLSALPLSGGLLAGAPGFSIPGRLRLPFRFAPLRAGIGLCCRPLSTLLPLWLWLWQLVDALALLIGLRLQANLPAVEGQIHDNAQQHQNDDRRQRVFDHLKHSGFAPCLAAMLSINASRTNADPPMGIRFMPSIPNSMAASPRYVSDFIKMRLRCRPLNCPHERTNPGCQCTDAFIRFTLQRVHERMNAAVHW